ncbi:MAG: lysophospholipid acyltransferase family protein [Pseudomonadota bacterium]|nr:lysophospholipid acyltransferase family protein [Pseudomonadota bacterium]
MAKLYFLPRTALKDNASLLRLGWRIEGWAVGAVIGLLRLLPFERAVACARRLFRAVGPRTGVATKLLRNLAIMHPDEPMSALRGRAADSMGNLGAALAEIANIDRIGADLERRVEFDVHPSVAAVLRDPQAAAVLITGHVGPWTLTNFIAAYGDFPLTIVYAPESNPFVRDRILALRSALPVKLIERDNSMRALLRELSAGHKIGLASDVRLDGGDWVPLLGHDMETNTVPARLALRQKCPLIPIRSERLPGGRFRITAEAAIEPEDPSADTEAKIASMARRLSGTYERWIREAPQEWMCMARRWPKHLELDAVARAEALERGRAA